MNPQPDQIIGNIVAVLFVLAIFFYTIQAIYSNKTTQISDKFIIGYVESDPIIIQHHNPPNDFREFDPTVNPLPPTQPSKKKKPKNIEEQPFYVDCVDALVALGMKRAEAKRKTKTILETSPKPSSIQSFLLTALKTK